MRHKKRRKKKKAQKQGLKIKNRKEKAFYLRIRVKFLLNV